MRRRIAALLVLLLLLGLVAVPASANGGEPTVTLAQHAALGTFLTDSHGMTLYIFTRDVPGTSNCYNQCAVNWPPLLVSAGQSPVAPAGLTGKLDTTARTDGTVQVTYNGMPLYYWVKDEQPGDILGQNVNNVWFVVNPDAPTVKLVEDPTLGTIMTDAKGMTLYSYSRDAIGTSNCYNQCAVNWPPLIVPAGQTPVAPVGLHGTLGTTTRKDGALQVTFNGMPLYYWIKDTKAGDTLGHRVNNVWWAVRPGQMLDIAGHWAELDVEAGVKAGWIAGHADGSFKPQDSVTRAEFVKMLLGALGVKSVDASASFTDTSGHWAAGVIEGAVAAGIIKKEEYPSGKFEPDKAITREEVATMAIRALGREGQAAAAAGEVAKFSDAGAVSAGAKGYLGLAATLHILGGYPDGSVRPAASATRAEAVVMVHRAVGAK